jgi:pimeloyl-ACP methyl ester carboxylesterase
MSLYYARLSNNDSIENRDAYPVRNFMGAHLETGLPKNESVKLSLKGILGISTAFEVMLPSESQRPFPTVMIIHGWAGWARMHASIVNHLLGRGFAVAMFDHPGRLSFDLDEWCKRATQAIDTLEKANAGKGSALDERLDFRRFGLLGHSYGGATAMALAGIDPRVKVAAAMSPGTALTAKHQFDSQAQNVKIPLLVIGAEYDGMCPAGQFARPACEACPARQKLYVEIARAGHFDFADIDIRTLADVNQVLLRLFTGKDPDLKGKTTISGKNQRTLAMRYYSPWLEHFLDVRQDGEGFTTGVMAEKDKAEGLLSVVLKSQGNP